MRVNHPAIGLLTPEPVAQVPAGFTLHKILLDQLIPARLPLTLPGSSGLLVLGVPSARARAWGEMPEASLVASATWQRAEAATSADLAASFGEARARLGAIGALLASAGAEHQDVPRRTGQVGHQLEQARALLGRQHMHVGPGFAQQSEAGFLEGVTDQDLFHRSTYPFRG